jgi:hypothetical protein
MVKKCPFLRCACQEHGCRLWINVQGLHPQTGEVVNEWDCSINWVPVLLVEVAQQARGGAAATESFRNVVLAASRGQPPPVDSEVTSPKKLKSDG